MRNPPEALKQFAEFNKNESKIAMPTYIGSNTQYLSVPFFQFNLRGQGNFRAMSLDPPILQFNEPLSINKTYSHQIVMKRSKNSESLSGESSSIYKKNIRVDGKSDESFIVEIDAEKFFSSTSSEEDIDIGITILSKTVGVKSAYIMIDIEDGVPLSYFIQAEFVGPTVAIVESNIEYGLQKVNSKSTFSMSILNESPIEAAIIVKNANDFMNYSFDAYYEQYQKEIKMGNDRHLVRSRKDNKSFCSIETKEKNKISFQPQCIVIPPNSTGEIVVTLESHREEIVSEILEVMVKDSESQFINLNANVQKLKVCLNRYNMNLGKVYAGIKQLINSKHPECIILKNYGNIPAEFHWNEVSDPERMSVQFEPNNGTIAPHSEFVVNIKFTAFLGGDFEGIFT